MNDYAAQWADEIQKATNIRMGTKARHKLGDISRDEPDYFIWHREDVDTYYGNWISGFGFINVAFPKDTTREMTAEERQFLIDHPAVIA